MSPHEARDRAEELRAVAMKEAEKVFDLPHITDGMNLYLAGYAAGEEKMRESLEHTQERYGQRIKNLVEERDSFIRIGNEVEAGLAAANARIAVLEEALEFSKAVLSTSRIDFLWIAAGAVTQKIDEVLAERAPALSKELGTGSCSFENEQRPTVNSDPIASGDPEQLSKTGSALNEPN